MKTNIHIDAGQVVLAAAVAGAAYLLYRSVQARKEAAVDRVAAVVAERPNSYAPITLPEQDWTRYVREGDTTYKLTKKDLASTTPFDKTLLYFGADVGTVVRANEIENRVASIFPWNW